MYRGGEGPTGVVQVHVLSLETKKLKKLYESALYGFVGPFDMSVFCEACSGEKFDGYV